MQEEEVYKNTGLKWIEEIEDYGFRCWEDEKEQCVKDKRRLPTKEE